MGEKKHCCQQNDFLAVDAPSKVRYSAIPPDHLRSEISSRGLVTFQNLGKTREKEAV